MLANYARITRWSAGLTAIIAAVMVGVSAAVGGSHGLIGALLGVALVAIFFGIDILVIGRVARISPQAMMVAGIILYLFKIIALAVTMSQLLGTTAFNTKLFGFTAIVCVLAWCAAQVITSIKFKTLYVNPDGER
jgi:ATP synthase protein I